MPIRPFLNGHRFDAEMTRIMGVAFDMACIALRLSERDALTETIANRIIELAEAGETNPDLLCERVLYEFGKPPGF